MTYTAIRKIHHTEIKKIILCLGNGKETNVKDQDKKIIKKYFKLGWIGYGKFNGYGTLLGYCFVKNPLTRPETMTVVRESYRNTGIATELRNYALEQREFVGHIIYSSVQLNNPASFKSILKSGYQVFDVTRDGYIQLIKILQY
jgi:hypothetical protein